MNKKYLAYPLFYFILILGLGVFLYCDRSALITAKAFEDSILPDNPVYVVKGASREISLIFAFSDREKTALNLDYAADLLQEATKMAAASLPNQEKINWCLEKYEGYIAAAVKSSAGANYFPAELAGQIFSGQSALSSLSLSNISQQKAEGARYYSLSSLADLLFSSGSPESLKQSVGSAAEKSSVGTEDKIKTLEDLRSLAPASLKLSLVRVEADLLSQALDSSSLSDEERYALEQDEDLLKMTAEYKQMATLDFMNKIVSGDQSLLSSSSLTTEDLVKLKTYASNFIKQNGGIEFNEVLAELYSLNFSDAGEKIIDTLQGEMVSNMTGLSVSCVAVYNPVCGRDGKTYDNLCNLGRAGISLSYYGECGSCVSEGSIVADGSECCSGLSSCPSGVKGKNVCQKQCSGNIACTNIWDPVCGDNGKTYGNQCFLARAGVNLLYDGECKEASSSPSLTTSPAVSLSSAAAISFCSDQGYSVKTVTGGDGTKYSVCVFAAGKQCEADSFYNGSCGSDYRRYIKIVRPYPQEIVCIDSDYEIVWESSGIDTVKISFTSATGAYQGKTLNVSTLEKGAGDEKIYKWRGGRGANGNILDPGLYTIFITSIPPYGQKAITSTIADPFEIRDCGGK